MSLHNCIETLLRWEGENGLRPPDRVWYCSNASHVMTIVDLHLSLLDPAGTWSELTRLPWSKYRFVSSLHHLRNLVGRQTSDEVPMTGYSQIVGTLLQLLQHLGSPQQSNGRTCCNNQPCTGADSQPHVLVPMSSGI